MNEQKFYETLGATPPLPAGLYQKINHRIRHARTVRAIMVSFAALLVLAIVPLTVGILKNQQDMLSAEVTSELETVQDYLHGNDLDQDLDDYAYLTTDFSKE